MRMVANSSGVIDTQGERNTPSNGKSCSGLSSTCRMHNRSVTSVVS